MVAKKMQTSAMKACFQIAECSFSYAKIQKIKQLACFYPKTIVLFTKNKITLIPQHFDLTLFIST